MRRLMLAFCGSCCGSVGFTSCSMAIAASYCPFSESDVAPLKMASVAAGSYFGLDMNLVHANQPPAPAIATTSTIKIAFIAEPSDGAGAGLGFAVGLRGAGMDVPGAVGGGMSGWYEPEVAGSSAKMSAAGFDAGGVTGATYPVAPPSAGT